MLFVAHEEQTPVDLQYCTRSSNGSFFDLLDTSREMLGMTMVNVALICL